MSRKLDRSDPPYVQIARQIRSDIESGALADGDSIPSARQIAATWDVALATATKVHARLRSEGLVRAVAGVGTVVTAGQRAFGPEQRVKSSLERGRIYGPGERAEIRAAEIVAAPDHVADALGLEPGAEVIRRERVTFVDDMVRSQSVSWFAGNWADLAPKLTTKERIREGTFAYLASAAETKVTGGREQIQARAADDDHQRTLGIELGSPVLMSRNWFHTADGHVLEFGESVRGADQWISREFSLT